MKDPAASRLRFGPFEESLRTMIAKPDFYNKKDWAKVELPSAAHAMVATGLEELPADQLARFNRLALDAAFPQEIAPIPPKQVQLAYFSWELGVPLPVEPEQLFPAINQLLVTVLALLLGVAGVFVAVIVTASMIPQTFEAGSIDLLLSKPIYRGWLFLAKFVGGCAFIAINAAYFIGGLWLLLGLRFGLWNERLLLAIPLYLFLVRHLLRRLGVVGHHLAQRDRVGRDGGVVLVRLLDRGHGDATGRQPFAQPATAGHNRAGR